MASFTSVHDALLHRRPLPSTSPIPFTIRFHVEKSSDLQVLLAHVVEILDQPRGT